MPERLEINRRQHVLKQIARFAELGITIRKIKKPS
jgi:hypothetical protein